MIDLLCRLSRGEIRAIDMWLAEDNLNPFGDVHGHVYIKTFKGKFIKSEVPNGFTTDKASRLRYILKTNDSVKPWRNSETQAQAEKESAGITGTSLHFLIHNSSFVIQNS